MAYIDSQGRHHMRRRPDHDKLTPFQKEQAYHFPFEGSSPDFPLRVDPDDPEWVDPDTQPQK